jgi:hypothetical protein
VGFELNPCGEYLHVDKEEGLRSSPTAMIDGSNAFGSLLCIKKY